MKNLHPLENGLKLPDAPYSWINSGRGKAAVEPWDGIQEHTM